MGMHHQIGDGGGGLFDHVRYFLRSFVVALVFVQKERLDVVPVGDVPEFLPEIYDFTLFQDLPRFQRRQILQQATVVLSFGESFAGPVQLEFLVEGKPRENWKNFSNF